VDLDVGRKGQLSMSQEMEDFITALKLLTSGLVDILLVNAQGHSPSHSAKDGSFPCR